MTAYRVLTPDDPPLSFLDCEPLGPAEALVIGAIWGHQDDHDRPTRLLHLKENEVRFADVQSNVISLCRDDGGVLALTKSGLSLSAYPQVGEPERIGRSEGGTMLQIRDLGHAQFSCGMNGQIYRRAGGIWSAFDENLYSVERSVWSEQLRDIGGVPDRRLVSVGIYGSVFEYLGSWQKQDLPTNASLERIAVDPEGRIWIAGERGILIRGDGSEWQMLDSGTQSSFWGFACYAETMYLSSLDGLWTLDRDTGVVSPLDTGLDLPLTTYRLQASKTDLWSVGPNDIARFDGSSWTRVSIPSNAQPPLGR